MLVRVSHNWLFLKLIIDLLDFLQPLGRHRGFLKLAFNLTDKLHDFRYELFARLGMLGKAVQGPADTLLSFRMDCSIKALSFSSTTLKLSVILPDC